ncbi:hypothetical protein [Mumia sp.]|nr:hypothetical protein [Mumia sp.]MDD9348552.1 hypothetical protein [Mumia sp.]
MFSGPARRRRIIIFVAAAIAGFGVASLAVRSLRGGGADRA